MCWTFVPFCAYAFSDELPQAVGSKLASPTGFEPVLPLCPSSPCRRSIHQVPQIRRSVFDNLTCIYVIKKMYISLNGRWNLWW